MASDIHPKNPAPKDWNPASPATLPKPSIYPVVVSLGSAFLAWGLISSLILTTAGAVLFASGMAGWIQELRHEYRKQEPSG